MEITSRPEYLIEPLESDITDLIIEIKNRFGLNHAPYDKIDDDLLLLAFTPDCRALPLSLQQNLQRKYSNCNHQVLEFYGDRVLYGVMSMILYEINGMMRTAHLLDGIMKIMVSNKTFTNLMLDKHACEFVRGSNYVIRQGTGSFHNICADSFEALVGALFIHLMKMRLDITFYIKNWIMSETALPYLIKEYLVDNNINRKVYLYLDRERFLAQILKDRSDIRDEMEERYGGLGQLFYEAHYQNPSANEIATKSLIIYPDRPLNMVYRELGWHYDNPKFDDFYYMTGYPNGLIKKIGIGRSPKEAMEMAYQYLEIMGHISIIHESKRIFK